MCIRDRIHPEDAATLDIVEGERVTITAQQDASASPLPETGIVRLSSPHQGLVSVTTLFADVVTGIQGSGDIDPSPSVRGLPLRHVSLAKSPILREAGMAAD